MIWNNKIRKIKTLPPGHTPGCRIVLLKDNNEQAHYTSKEGNAFDECRSHDHVGADVAGSFRLTGNGFDSSSTYPPDTHPGTNSCQCGTESGTNFCVRCKISCYL